MRRPAKFALGCLFAPVGLFVLGLLFFGMFRAMGVPDAKMTDTRVAQDLPVESRTELVPLPNGSTDAPATAAAVRVDLDLDMGNFRIEPGPAEDGITVDASYDEATYYLEREYDVEDGIPTFRMRFGSKISLLRRLVQDGNISDDDMAVNQITVFLPEGVPMDLRVHLRRSESTVDLSGLAITDLVTNLGLGSYEFESRADNPVVMRRARFEVGMGETRIDGLSHLRARAVEIKGGMGEVKVDFGTSLLLDTVIAAHMRMGELTLRVPDDAILDRESSFRATMGEVDDSGVRGRRIEDPEQARRLTVSGSVLMGQLTIDEFRAGSSGVFDEPR